MKKMLGIKTSAFLWIYRAIVYLISIVAVLGILFVIYKSNSQDLLTDEQKEEIRSERSFLIAAEAAIKLIEKPEVFGSLDDATAIEYLKVSYSTTAGGKKHTKEYVSIESNDTQYEYFDVQADYALITAEMYNNYKEGSYFEFASDTSSTKTYEGAELKLLKDTLAGKTEQGLSELKKSNLMKRKTYAQVGYLFSHLLFQSKDISKVRCAIVDDSPLLVYYEINYNNPEKTEYYVRQINRIYRTDSFASISPSDIEIYTSEDLEILFGN